MSIRWIRRAQCAWRARRLLGDITLLADAYRRSAEQLSDGFDENVFSDAHGIRRILAVRFDELEAYLIAGDLPDTWETTRRERLSAIIDKTDASVDKARTQHNEMLLLEYEANGMDPHALEHIRQAMAGTDGLLGGIEVMRLDEEQ